MTQLAEKITEPDGENIQSVTDTEISQQPGIIADINMSFGKTCTETSSVGSGMVETEGITNKTYPESIIDELAKKKETRRKDINQEDLAHLTIWDFAGQDVFFDTHHMFLTNDGVYIFVFNVEEWKTSNDKIKGK